MGDREQDVDGDRRDFERLERRRAADRLRAATPERRAYQKAWRVAWYKTPDGQAYLKRAGVSRNSRNRSKAAAKRVAAALVLIAADRNQRGEPQPGPTPGAGAAS